MTTEQINRLAAEYADYHHPTTGDSYHDGMRADYYSVAKSVLNWLLRDHLIVEKSKVMDFYKGLTETQTELPVEKVAVETVRCVIEQLFPEAFNPTEK